MVFIINKNNLIISISETLENAYQTIITYIKLMYYTNNNISSMDQINITEYNNNNIINIYILNSNNLNIYDINNNIILEDNFLIKKLIKDLNRIINTDKKDSIDNIDNKNITELNIQIPIYNDIHLSSDDNDNDIYIKSNKNSNIEINSLRDKIEIEKKKLEENNIKYENNLNNFLKHKNKYYLLKTKINNIKDKEEEKYRKYQVAKKTFIIINHELINNIRDINDIPELFKNDYIIFKYIIKNYPNIDDKEEFKKYKMLLKNINFDNIKINTEYDDIFKENIIYKNLQDNFSDFSNDSEDN